MGKKRKKLKGTVEKVVKWKDEAEKAQIGINGADHLYREIRVENVLADEKGQETKLR